MRCPYLTKQTIESFTGAETNTEDTEPSFGVSKKVTTYVYEECLKENCAAWQNGKCVLNMNSL